MDWKRLGRSIWLGVKDWLIVLGALILILIPIGIIYITHSFWWLSLYPLGFLVLSIYDKYNSPYGW